MASRIIMTSRYSRSRGCSGQLFNGPISEHLFKPLILYTQTEARDLEACNLQLFSLEQSWEINLMPNMDKNKFDAARARKHASYAASK